jgi:hypothetical protein
MSYSQSNQLGIEISTKKWQSYPDFTLLLPPIQEFLLSDVYFCPPHQYLLHAQPQNGPNHQQRCIPRCPSMSSVLSRYWGSLWKFKFLVRNLRDGAS